VIDRRRLMGMTLAAAAMARARRAAAADPAAARAVEALHGWYRLVLELVRHTPTYSPPVAARTFGYLGVALHEALVPGRPELRSLAGQVAGLAPPPVRPGCDSGVLVDSLLAALVAAFFANTGPTGQRALARRAERSRERAAAGVPPAAVAESTAVARALAGHILAWAATDGGAVIENLGFTRDYELKPGPAHWVPTNAIPLQQVPLLPHWGTVRPFAMPSGSACTLPPPPDYSEEPGSAFHEEAMEVYRAVTSLSPEERAIALFWADDPMLSPTPPGHWVSIALQCVERAGLPLEGRAEVLALLGVALADAFIACWEAKYRYDLLRPVTYIRRVIDPAFEPVITTPPFPEYPSGHSTCSGAAATVLRALLGDPFPFEDRTHEADGLAPRRFAGFWEAALEASRSRLLGGVHFRSALEQGLAQGRCVAGHVLALRIRV
jgi:hypothetical protein